SRSTARSERIGCPPRETTRRTVFDPTSTTPTGMAPWWRSHLTALMSTGEPAGAIPSPHEHDLRRSAALVLARCDPLPGAGRAQLPGLGVVGEQGLEDRLELVASVGVLDRDDDLDPVVEVSRHQVGAAEVVRPGFVGFEAVEPAVLEEAA